MKYPEHILVVDDDKSVLEVLEARLSASGFKVFKAENGPKALQILAEEPVDAVISDVKMPKMGGMHLLSEMHSIRPELPVIFLTAYGTIADAVKAVQAGATDYLTKPFDGRELVRKLKTIPRPTADCLNDSLSSGDERNADAVKSPGMRQLYDMIERVAASDVNVLILGESGVGKERAARQIHHLSRRQTNPFLVVDCGATPSGLLESELFGHIKGSFTHAIRDKRGLIEAADSGTLFLDEIGNISAEMQMRLLRFIEARTIRKIGSLQEAPVDCRIISATHVDLAAAIRQGQFREDLYYRLRVVTLRIPPLRERRQDIPLLTQRFVKNFCKVRGIKNVSLPPETIKWLCEYPWPGNVRELKNAIEGGIIFARHGVLRVEDLRLCGLPEHPVTTQNACEDSLLLADNERNTIVKALQQTSGVQKDAAVLLGISRRAIHYKIKKFGINVRQL